MPDRVALVDFRSCLPAYRITQQEAHAWLAQAHQAADPHSPPAERIARWIERFGCSPEKIRTRYHELPDFRHFDWERMRIYCLKESASGVGMAQRSRFYDETVERVFDEMFAKEEVAPDHLLHVTCTGYVSPSSAQRVVQKKGWGQETEVTHVYHMGCYASIPAVRIGAGYLASCTGARRCDVMHTELCTLHLDPRDHAPDQLVVQSLFADGHIRYSVARMAEKGEGEGRAAFEILAVREEQVPGSQEDMTWNLDDSSFRMTLSREVPAKIASGLAGFIERICGSAGLPGPERDWVWAIHPGGPRIIDQIQDLLRLEDGQVRWSRDVLGDHGNMSSATLPHIWMRILEDPLVAEGAPILSLAFGPGLTIAGAVFRKTRCSMPGF